ncbi:MAG: DNA-formamidopyrimidine glycosylase family protein [Actinomycetota bacterium]|nr:DNA-formamidopyrimidine glycosylase family protein [Actinomycetota bacterium]
MPEGHVVHALARRLGRMFVGQAVRVDSPQGRFWDGAALVDGQVVAKVEAHGKHLFIGFANRGWMHVHLGLYGKWRFGDGDPPVPVGQVRARIVGDGAWAELRGPSVCEVLDDLGRRDAIRRIGPDPIRRDADPGPAWEKASRSASPIGILLMDQAVISGVGNIYRAEVLFRHGISPYRPSREVTREEFDAVWADLVGLMRDGARRGRIDTVRREHTPRAMGRPPRRDRHGGEVYVYRRTGRPCLACGTPVASADLNGRTLYWCPGCQPT